MNYLASTKIDPSTCRGFEDEAFQALFGLVHYVEGQPGQRDAWYRAVWNARMNTTGSLKAGPDNKSFFYSAIVNRKNSAFGYALTPPGSGLLDAGEYPWALDDRTFQVVNDEVKHNKGPAGGQETSWKERAAEFDKWREDHGATTPVALASWSVIGWLVKKYAPEAAIWVAEKSPIALVGGPAVAYLGNAFENYAIRCNNAAAKANFATDERRRLFDAAHPISSGDV